MQYSYNLVKVALKVYDEGVYAGLMADVITCMPCSHRCTGDEIRLLADGRPCHCFASVQNSKYVAVLVRSSVVASCSAHCN